MATEKNVPVSFHVRPKCTRLLARAADRTCRSHTNLIETLLYQYCKDQGIVDQQLQVRPAQSTIRK